MSSRKTEFRIKEKLLIINSFDVERSMFDVRCSTKPAESVEEI